MRLRKILFLLPFIFLTTTGIVKAQDTTNKKMPNDLIFMTLDNIIYTNKDLPKDEPVLIFYYQPDCGHCQIQGKKLAANLGQYPQMKILLISNYPVEEIKKYVIQEGFFPANRLVVLQDFKMNMHNWFDFAYVPLMLLYNPEGKLIKDFDEIPDPAEMSKIIKGFGK